MLKARLSFVFRLPRSKELPFQREPAVLISQARIALNRVGDDVGFEHQGPSGMHNDASSLLDHEPVGIANSAAAPDRAPEHVQRPGDPSTAGIIRWGDDPLSARGSAATVLICRDAELMALDGRLRQAFRRLRDAASLKQSEREALVADQRLWVETMDQCWRVRENLRACVKISQQQRLRQLESLAIQRRP